MKTIWKYEVPIQDRFELLVPSPQFEILHFGLDPRGMPCVWIIVQPSMVSENIHKTELRRLENHNHAVRFAVVGTGNLLPDDVGNWNYVGTINQTINHQGYVWHLFQID